MLFEPIIRAQVRKLAIFTFFNTIQFLQLTNMKKYFFWIALFCLFSLNSCLIPQKVVYVKDMVIDSAYLAQTAPPLRVQNNDRLSIQVSSKNPELAAPFNLGNGGYLVDEQGKVNLSSSIVTNNYLVGNNGSIDFPILGSIQVKGKTTDEIRYTIEDRLKSENLINDPQVKVDLLNLKITMMGEIGGVGTINVPEGRITLLEAISNAGGLTSNALSDQVMVIREENGVRKMYVNNVEETEIFNSPTYYLQQNDIVYVKPKAAKRTPREEQNWRYITMGTSLITLTFTLFALFTK